MPSTFGLGFKCFFVVFIPKVQYFACVPLPLKKRLPEICVCEATVDLLVEAKESEKIVNKTSAKSQRDLKFCEKGYHHDANM